MQSKVVSMCGFVYVPIRKGKEAVIYEQLFLEDFRIPTSTIDCYCCCLDVESSYEDFGSLELALLIRLASKL